MNRTHRQQCRQAFERWRRAAYERRESLVKARARTDQAVRYALARCAARGVQVPHGASTDCARVFERAPRLAIEPYATAVMVLVEHSSHLSRKDPWYRTVADWCPRGRGRDSIFRSLGEHLLARVPVPSILWAGFFDDLCAQSFAPLVAHVAAGGSLFDFIATTGFPIKLTRRMCHELLSMRACGSLLEAIRRVQVHSVGGDDRLLHAWKSTGVAQSIGSEDDETFWFAVLAWLARASARKETLDPAQVGPIVDYLDNRHERDARFSLAGRTLGSVTRAMREWHRELGRERVVRNVTFDESGYVPMVLHRSERDRDGQVRRHIWRVDEIRTLRELAIEGRRMNHCVYSYAPAIEKGLTSIWTMTLEDGGGPTGRWAMLTIEVRRDLRRVVQARGRFNRAATHEEMDVLMAWARRNDLEVSLA